MNTEERKPEKHFVINEDTIKGRWKEMKGDVQKMWGKLTDDELDQAKGDLKSLSGIIQRRYGESKEAVDTKLSEYFSNVKAEVAKSAEKAKDAVAAATESAKKKM